MVFCPVSVVFTGSAVMPCSSRVSGAGGLSADAGVSYSGNTNAGTAGAQGVFAGDANHLGSVSAGVVFTIAKAPTAFFVYCPSSVVFTGSAQTPCTGTVTGAGGLSATVAGVYSANTNAGSASVVFTFAGDANHSGSSAGKSFTISKASSAVALTCTLSVVFTGSARTPCTASVSGPGGLSASVAPSYSGNTNAGAATAQAVFAGDANHVSAAAPVRTFVISKAASVTVVSCPSSVVFTGSALTPCTVSVTGAGGLSVAPVAVYSANTGVGTATAAYTYAGDANHAGSQASRTFTITKRT